MAVDVSMDWAPMIDHPHALVVTTRANTSISLPPSSRPLQRCQSIINYKHGAFQRETDTCRYSFTIDNRTFHHTPSF